MKHFQHTHQEFRTPLRGEQKFHSESSESSGRHQSHQSGSSRPKVDLQWQIKLFELLAALGAMCELMPYLHL